jgi:hypothetical protein
VATDSGGESSGILQVSGAGGSWVQIFTMRIAASIYLNSAPLVHSFVSRQGGHTFLGDTAPARCAQLLASGQM